MFDYAKFVAIAGIAWCALSAVAHSAEPPRTVETVTYSLAEDFSYTENSDTSTWSYRLDDVASTPPTFPLLTSTNRNATSLWGAPFRSAPWMWSDASGYWGIGKNVTGKEQLSARTGTRWPPGEVLLHPKSGDSPSGLVVGWKAPERMLIDVKYSVGLDATNSNGVGLKIMKRVGNVDTEIVAVPNVGYHIANELTGIVVAQGDQLFFRFDNCGEPGGDIVRVGIIVKGTPLAAARKIAVQPSGGVVVAGSNFTFSVPTTSGKTLQWCKNDRSIPGATNASYQINNAKQADAGTYSVAIDSAPSGNVSLEVTPKEPIPGNSVFREGMTEYPFLSPTPHQVFSETLEEQEKELKTNELMLRFAESRKKLAAAPYRPTYHFISPESMMNDPSGPCFWQGHWHLFYQVFPPDAFPDPKDRRSRLLQAHWGHAITDDWVHWRDLPYAIYPSIERVCATGGVVIDEDRVVAFYPGHEAGQMVAISEDPLLLNWKKLGNEPVNSPQGDACIWKEQDTYYGLVGVGYQPTLLSSKNLQDWTNHGAFVEANPFPMGDAVACPDFLPIGDKHILLTFSHTLGGQYLLGDYDRAKHRFRPYEHGRFNHGTVAPGGVHAPAGVADGKGGVIAIHNINDGRHTEDWDQLLSLPQHLTLGPDKKLRIEPIETIASLRGGHQHIDETVLPANQEIVLEAIKGNAMEVEAEFDPKDARWVQLNVLRSPHAEEQTSITFYNYDRELAFWYYTQGVVCLDGSHSSILSDAWPRSPEKAVMERKGEPLRLRVFVDRSVVEVFVNEKLYLAMRVYPGRNDSVGVSLRAQGQDAVLKRLDAWQMKAIWPLSLSKEQ